MERFISVYLAVGFLLFNLVFGYLNHRFQGQEKPVTRKDPSFAILVSIRFILILGWSVFFFLAEGYKYKLFEKVIESQSVLTALKIGGLVLFTLGGLLILWGRASLGEWFSTKPVVKKGHRLIQAGPYRLMRHPIYVGIILALWGLTLALDSLVTLLILAIPFMVVIYLNAKAEERLLGSSLKGEYEKYKSQVPMFVPVGKKDLPS